MRDAEKAVIGLSGGVDSAVAALLLKNSGFNVLGVYLKSPFARDESGAARKAAEELGIGFHLSDIGEALFSKVCLPFVSEYARGRTPNPCVFCNSLVKFKALSAVADAFGAKRLATGHYAGTAFVPSQNRFALVPGKPGHDQSYMLYRLPGEVLARLLLPLGGMTKPEVRRLAGENGINAAHKPDSMEICFVPDGDRIGFIERYAQSAPVEGNFIDDVGAVLGPHRGIHRYTVGQRKGLGISMGAPVYISKIDSESGNITLSRPGGEYKKSVDIFDCVWSLETEREFEARIRVRHSKTFTPGTVTKTGGQTAEVYFPEGIRAPAPGQSLVCYVDIQGVGTAVAGGGIIE